MGTRGQYRVSFLIIPTLFLETRSLAGLATQQAQETSEMSPPPRTGITGRHHCAWLFWGAGTLTQRAPCLHGRHLQMELSPLPYFVFTETLGLKSSKPHGPVTSLHQTPQMMLGLWRLGGSPAIHRCVWRTPWTQ